MAKLDLGLASTDWVVVRIGALPDLLALQSELERARVPVRVQLPECLPEVGFFVGEPTLYVPRTFVEDAELIARRLDPKYEPEQAPGHGLGRASAPDAGTAEARSTEDAASQPTSSARSSESGDELARRVERERSANPAGAESSSTSAPPDAELERTRALARRIRYAMPSLILAPVSLALAPRYLRSSRRRDLTKTERWTTDVAVALALPATVFAAVLLWMLALELEPLIDLVR